MDTTPACLADYCGSCPVGCPMDIQIKNYKNLTSFDHAPAGVMIHNRCTKLYGFRNSLEASEFRDKYLINKKHDTKIYCAPPQRKPDEHHV